MRPSGGEPEPEEEEVELYLTDGEHAGLLLIAGVDGVSVEEEGAQSALEGLLRKFQTAPPKNGVVKPFKRP
ncbi:MAG: hypothetical protein H6974_09565 [Gammaproteobacteria bacterium]|nr:hypothetical protein [Gammaproteobacteria bacterium]